MLSTRVREIMNREVMTTASSTPILDTVKTMAGRKVGRVVIAELPTADDLVLVSQDDHRFYYGERAIAKDLIVAVRMLINGSPIASYVSRRHAASTPPPTSFEDLPEGIARDRWDVAVETVAGTTLIECGAIRERVSQELARTVFDAIKKGLEQRDR